MPGNIALRPPEWGFFHLAHLETVQARTSIQERLNLAGARAVRGADPFGPGQVKEKKENTAVGSSLTIYSYSVLLYCGGGVTTQSVCYHDVPHFSLTRGSQSIKGTQVPPPLPQEKWDEQHRKVT